MRTKTKARQTEAYLSQKVIKSSHLMARIDLI